VADNKAVVERMFDEVVNIAEFRQGRAHRHKVLMDLPTLLQQLGVAGPTTP